VMGKLNHSCTHENAQPVLHEVRHALDKLIQQHESTVIDLHALPMTKIDFDEIFDTLGRGELHIVFNGLGKSEIWDTYYQGVWVIEHHPYFTDDCQYFIEINKVPDLLVFRQKDLSDSLSCLEKKLMV
jgi:hydrogenase-1 operon protein HyaF